MDRRNFLRSLVGGVAAAAAVRTFPFRVYSFPPALTNVYYDGIAGIAYFQDDGSIGRWNGLARFPIAMVNEGTFPFFVNCADGGELGRGSATAWAKADSVKDVIRLHKAGYRIPGMHAVVVDPGSGERMIMTADEPNPIASPLPKLVIDRRDQWRQLLKRA